MAAESMNAARLAEDEGFWRSSISRYYYSAFQSMIAVLQYLKMTPPKGWEAWTHAETPGLLKIRLSQVISRRDTRNRIARHLGEMYKVRIIADYVSGDILTSEDLKRVRREAALLMKIAVDILPENETK